MFAPMPASVMPSVMPSIPASMQASLPSLASLPPLSSVGGATAPTATPSPFIGDSLFSHQNQDLLRRELDTRFLASQDRSINIPPPPYMRTEMHEMQLHLQQNQSNFALPTAMAGSLMTTSNPHMYDKYPKLDATFYGRSALGLPGFPSLSPLLTHGSTSSTPQASSLSASSSTPFGPPGHLAAFQPKMNSLSNKSKPTVKSGRWCAMHVRIAWEIYHHQQKQQQMDITHKTSTSNTSVTSKSSSASDILRPLNHLFQLLPRPHEMPPFSPSLLSGAGVHSSRASFESQLASHASHASHHSQYGSSSASAPLIASASSNFTRFPGFGGFSSLNSALSLLPGPTPTSSTLFGASALTAGRDLPIVVGKPGCLPGLSASVPDPWSRNSSTRVTSALYPPLTSTASSNSSSWGGLKAEAYRDPLFSTLTDCEKMQKYERDSRTHLPN